MKIYAYIIGYFELEKNLTFSFRPGFYMYSESDCYESFCKTMQEGDLTECNCGHMMPDQSISLFNFPNRMEKDVNGKENLEPALDDFGMKLKLLLVLDSVKAKRGTFSITHSDQRVIDYIQLTLEDTSEVFLTHSDTALRHIAVRITTEQIK